MKLKLCGLTRAEDVACVNTYRPEYVGFVFAQSRRKVSAQTAAVLKEALHQEILAVGVFADEKPEHIIRLLGNGVIDIAQLHGKETEEEIRYLKQETGRQIWKAVRADTRKNVENWLDSQADCLVFDSGGGSGQLFDWGILNGISRPFFLAGGIRYDILEEAARLVTPFGIDISSGAETDGCKDPHKIKAIVEKMKTITAFQAEPKCRKEDKA